jgi:probable HAF family extracellular repeat protein
MMSSHRWSAAAAAALLLLPAAAATAAPPRSGLISAYLGDWGRGGYVLDANERGDVVGALNDENADPQPVLWPRDGAPVRIAVDRGTPAAVNERGDVVGDNWLWSDGQVRTLAEPSRQMRAVDVNDRRQVTGTIDPDGSGVERMFLWQDGRFTTFSAPAGLRGYPRSVNNRGEVLGYLTDPTWSQRRGFVWHAGRMTILEPLGGTVLEPRAINDRGQVVGYTTVAGSEVLHAFLWQDGRMRDLMAGRPDETGQAWDVNNAGEVTGNIGSLAVVWRGGRTVDLAVPGRYTNARDVNERGEVTGWAIAQGTGQIRVFRWSDSRFRFSEPYTAETIVEIAGIDGRGRVAGVIDDLVVPPRPVRWVAG